MTLIYRLRDRAEIIDRRNLQAHQAKIVELARSARAIADVSKADSALYKRCVLLKRRRATGVGCLSTPEERDRLLREVDLSFSIDALRELLLHMEWADATLWRALLAHPPAAEDRRIRDLLLHVHGVQRAFLQVWTSTGPLTFPTMDASADLSSIQAWASSYYLELATAFAHFDMATLTRAIEMPGLGEYEERLGRRFDKPTLAETILQVTSHSTYHRGQLYARPREIGGEPPLVDYIAWIWFGRPAAEWARVA